MVVETEDMKVKIEEATIIVARVVVATMMAAQAEEMMEMVVIGEEAMTMVVEEEVVVVRDKDKEIWVNHSSNHSSSKVRVSKAKVKDNKVKVVQKGKEEVKENLVDMRVREEGNQSLLLPLSSSSS
jgi:hypothetical protein